MGLRSVIKSSRRSKGSLAGEKADAASMKREMIEKYLQAHSSSSQLSLREQLRAKSFFRKEMASADTIFSMNSAGKGDSSPNSTVTDKEIIQSLEADVQRLAEKCSALESQNILVSVQQLDILAKAVSYLLSFAVLLLYWKAIMWSRDNISLEMLSPLTELLFSYNMGREYADTLADVFDLLKHPWTCSALHVFFVVFPYLYNRSTHGSMHRRFQVFVIAFIIVGRIRLCRWRERMFVQAGTTKTKDISDIPRFGESCTDDGIWEANYEISARFLYLSILRLRGLWTKTAQYLSSRADFVPVSYIRELSKLQDQTEATPWDQVEKMLSPKLLEMLTDIDKTPLASASIGQVHTATLKSTNQKVVIKVQHPDARTLMTDDFRSLKILCRVIAWMEPEYAFMEILMNEWAKEARKELNFEFEADHLTEANLALRDLMPTANDVVHTASSNIPFRVEVPRPISELSNQFVLVMNFCEGCKVNDFDRIESWNLPRSAIMDGISQAFAHSMYCTNIFNADPHPANLLVRPGITLGDKHSSEGFTLVLLDWGLAKKLPEQKRLAFCQMVMAAATFDYGLLLDSYNTVGLKMKREDTGQSMEDMRFFLRDMAPRDETRKQLKSKIKADKAKRKETKEKVPMESKAYPGEFFFFIRVNELLHGLGGSYSVNLGYLDTLKPYAERGLRSSSMYDLDVKPSKPIPIQDSSLQQKLETVLKKLETDNQIAGAQVCVLDKDGGTQADLAAGNLGGLRSHLAMTRDAVVLGYSTTKAITSTLAHIMVQQGYIEYDEPICERAWRQFCPTEELPKDLDKELNLTIEEARKRWIWKRQITLRNILNHTAGMYAALPKRLTVERFAACEDSFSAYEYNPEAPQETLLPTIQPGGKSEYHYLSFGWLVAGALCGAYALKHNKSKVAYEEVYRELLQPKLSNETLSSGFYPMGGYGESVHAQTTTADIRASKIMQMRREASVMGDGNENENGPQKVVTEALEGFKGKEFLLDPRIWNCERMLKANVPAAGGRFSACSLANFYLDLSQGKLLPKEVLDEIVSIDNATELSLGSELQGVTRIASDGASVSNTKMNFGYQRIRTDRDGKDAFSCVGHAGVGGSIGFWHVKTGLCVGLMLNKSGPGTEATKKILGVIADHYEI